MGCAKTGSGKTAAFALPIIQKLSEDPYGVFALVITPTRSDLLDVLSAAHDFMLRTQGVIHLILLFFPGNWHIRLLISFVSLGSI